MKLQQLQYFTEAVKYSSISKAAEVLHVSQPTISISIQELEKEFNVPLIARRYQGFTLTAEGKEFYDLAISLLKQASLLQDQMEQYGNADRPVHFGITPMMGSLLLSDLYKKIWIKYPNISLKTEELGSRMLLKDIKADVLNLAVLIHQKEFPREFDSLLVNELELVWCCLPSHYLAEKKSITAEDLKDEPLVMFDDNFAVSEVIADYFQDAGITPYIIHSTQQLYTVQNMIRDGIATGFLLKPIAEQFPWLTYHSLPRTVRYSLVWLKKKALHSNVKKIIQLFEEGAS